MSYFNNKACLKIKATQILGTSMKFLNICFKMCYQKIVLEKIHAILHMILFLFATYGQVARKGYFLNRLESQWMI
jgi:hypothetical protein